MAGSWARLFREEGFLVIVVTVGNVGNFVFHIYMSRNLGPDGYGQLTALLSLLYILSIPTMTIQASLAQFIATRAALGDRAGARALYMGGLWRVGALALLATVAICACARVLGAYLHLADARLVWLLALLVGTTVMLPAFLGGLQGLRLFQPLGIALLLSLTVKCGLGIGLVAGGGGVASAMVALVLSLGVAVAVAEFTLRRTWGPTPPAPVAPDFRPVLLYTIPVSLGFLALAPFANLDIVLVRHYLPAVEAGRYASTMILGKAFLFLPVGIVLALFPNVAHAVARREDPRQLLWPALGLGAGLSLVGAVICLVVPGLLARLLVRSSDPTIVPLIRWVGFAMTPAGLGTILLQYHMARKHWRSLPGVLLAAAAFVLAVVFRHGSSVQVLQLVAAGSTGVFVLLLLGVWWPSTAGADVDQHEPA